MKNNSLYRNILPRGAGVFLKTVVLVVLFITQLTAQNSNNNNTLPLKTGHKIMQENIQDTGFAKNALSQQLFEGKSYVLLQFYQLPDVQMHKKIKELGIELTQYIAANTYRAAIPEGISIQSLAQLNVRAVDVLTGIEKIEPLLLRDQLPEHVEVVPEKIDIKLVLEDNINIKSVRKALQPFEIEYLDKEVRYRKHLSVRINKEDIENIAEMPFITFILPAPPEPTRLSASATRESVVRAEYVRRAYGLEGEGVVAGISEGIDGYHAINHIDLRGNTTPIMPLDHNISCQGDVENAGEVYCDDMDSHGEQVCSMAGGQGILRPSFAGSAPQMSMLYIDKISPISTISDALVQYSSQNIAPLDRMVLTNQSHTGGNGAVVDRELRDYPETMQVAAAGNAGVKCTAEEIVDGEPFPCNTYPDMDITPRYFTLGKASCCGSGYGNPTSTATSGKNLITVGGIDMYGRIIDNRKSGSSKGPTWDGRIKPEVVAVAGKTHEDSGHVLKGGASTASVRITEEIDGDGDECENCRTNEYGGLSFGTSYASPQVMGGLALLYEYYRENLPASELDILGTHPNPSGALIKAITCNTADDLGNPGPDYVYGFGKLNLRKAINVLENEWYLSGEFSQGSTYSNTDTYQIVVPNDKPYHQLKIMLYWPDNDTYVGADYTSCQLINNLDLVVNGNIYPLRPDPGPLDIQWVPPLGEKDPPTDIHTQPATSTANNCANPVDCNDCNNIEQVVITDASSLVPGTTYNVEVKPKYVPGSTAHPDQPYYLVWEFIEPGITITSPHKDEMITNSLVHNYLIEWDYEGTDTDPDNKFVITITNNDDINAEPDVYDDIDEDLRMYKWAKCDMRDMNSSNVTIKIERLNTSYSDEHTFRVYNSVNHGKLIPDYLCGNRVCLSWNIECSGTPGVPPAYFTVYKYVEEYDGNGQLIDNDMKPILTTSDYSVTIDFDQNKEEEWYSVSSTYYNSTTGEYVETTRCKAKPFTVPSIVGCGGNEICEAVNCPAGIAGTPCNDDDPCTSNDVYGTDCNCAGTITDTNGDGIPDSGTCTDCPINLVIEDSDVSGAYEASNFIKTDEYAPVSVAPEEQLTLSAGKYIDLNPGFSAEAGSVYSLYAYIEGCDPMSLARYADTPDDEIIEANQLNVKHFPNPFNEEVTLELQLNFDAEVTVTISDINGRVIHRVESGYLNQGIQTFNIPTQKWIDGVYFYRVSAKMQNTNVLKYANGILAKM